jgi:hypothetical protein
VSNKFSNGGSYNANLLFNGGSQLSLLDCPTGNIQNSLWNRTGIVAAGYIRSADGHVNLDCPVPARSSTWSEIKARHQ